LEAGEDGVADPSVEGAEGLFAGLALGDLPVVAGAAVAVAVRIWVTAAMWMTWLRRRFPRRLSRWILRFPEDISIGAVPL
jgi:hypothetical protein